MPRHLGYYARISRPHDIPDQAAVLETTSNPRLAAGARFARHEWRRHILSQRQGHRESRQTWRPFYPGRPLSVTDRFDAREAKRDPTPNANGDPSLAADDATTARTAKAPRGSELDTLHRLLVESVRDYAIFALDPKGFVLSWNAGAE